MQRPGCLALFVVFTALFLLPLLFLDLMTTALEHLGLPLPVAILLVLGIVVGGMVNVPVHRIEREEATTIDVRPMFGFHGIPPLRFYSTHSTLLAVNLGGCVIPCAIAAYEIGLLAVAGGRTLAGALVITAINVAVCYHLARPIEGIGIAMPALIPPLIAAFGSLLLIEHAAHRPQAAFIAGTLGTLIGADLLHLRDIRLIRTPMASIGGAGTFDGIVLSGIVAAFIA